MMSKRFFRLCWVVMMVSLVLCTITWSYAFCYGPLIQSEGHTILADLRGRHVYISELQSILMAQFQFVAPTAFWGAVIAKALMIRRKL